MLVLDNFSFSLGNHSWSHNLHLAAGQSAVIMGASGRGKTSLLNALAGFLPCTSGRLLIQGQAVQNLPAERRPLAYVFQQQNFFQHLTMAANLRLGFPQAKPSPEQWQTLLNACAELQVDTLLPRLPEQISGGQQQRLALIRALVRPQPVALLDEAFSALDAATRLLALNWLKRTATQQGKACLVVSHNPADAELLGAKLIQLD